MSKPATRRMLPWILGAVAAASIPQAWAAPELNAEIEALKQRIQSLEARQEQPPPAATTNGEKFGETQISWGGHVKLDALYSRFSEGEVTQGTARDFYLPNATPVGNGDKSREFLDLHAKETRLFVKSRTPLSGHTLGTHVELDFIVNQSSSANERVTNAYTPGFRRAFVTWDNWLFGQEWTTFQNLAALPEVLDFVAFPSECTVFNRQPQVRYTAGPWSLSLENPETSILPYGGGAIFDSHDAKLPDAIARYDFRFGNGHELSLAGIVRQLAIHDAPIVDGNGVEIASGRNDKASGYGASLAGKLNLGTDDLKFMISGGKGIGRYLALGTSADAVVDGSNELEPVEVFAAYLAYRHAWTSRWRSTVTASMFRADNDIALTGAAATRQVHSVSVNLLYSPVPRLTFGGEFRHAEREIENGLDGALDRLQLSVKFAY